MKKQHRQLKFIHTKDFSLTRLCNPMQVQSPSARINKYGKLELVAFIEGNVQAWILADEKIGGARMFNNATQIRRFVRRNNLI